MSAADVRGLILDLDGVLLRGEEAIEGAAEALATLTRAGLSFVVLSNRTDPSKEELLAFLNARGIALPFVALLSGIDALRGYLATQPAGPCYLLTSAGFRRDLLAAGVPVADEAGPAARYVVVGANCAYDPGLVAGAVEAIASGARLVGVNRAAIRVRTSERHPVQLGPGFLIAGLEQTTGTQATLVGKPHPAFFAQALARLDLPPRHVLVVGDRPHEDIEGARAAGCQAVLVSPRALPGVESSVSLASVVEGLRR